MLGYIPRIFLGPMFAPIQTDLSLILKVNPLILIKSSRDLYSKVSINPGNERQKAYDLTYKWNLIDKTNKHVKYNQRH